MSKVVDPKVEKKEEVKSKGPQSGVGVQHNVPTARIFKRGYHYFAVPEGAQYIKFKLIGGGGGSGGSGSGGTSNSTTVSGGGGGGSSGGGDGEVFPNPAQADAADGYHLDVTNLVPVQGKNGEKYYSHIGVYVGRGGAGGDGGKAVGGSTATQGRDGTNGASGRHTFIFGMPAGAAINHSSKNILSYANAAAIIGAINNHDGDTALLTNSVGTTHIVPFAYARGGFGGLLGRGGQAYEGVTSHGLSGYGGAGGTGVAGFYSISSGPGGNGGYFSTNTAGDIPAPSAIVATSAYLYKQAAPGTTGEAGFGPAGSGPINPGSGGDGGRSNFHRLDIKVRTTGFGGHGHDPQDDGIDFDGDLDPEPLAESESNGDCVDSHETYGVAIGGAGGAGAGPRHALGRNGADSAYPVKEFCDCVEIIRPADGKCAHLPKMNEPGYVPGVGAPGSSGGSGMFKQETDGTFQKSGAGADGTRGANGAVYFTIYGEGGVAMPTVQVFTIEQVDNA